MITELGMYNSNNKDLVDKGGDRLIEELDSAIFTLEKISEITSKTSKDFSYLESEIFKNIEDAILDNIHLCSDYQREHLLLGRYKFKYYIEFNDLEVLKLEIKKRLRKQKIKELDL